MDTAFQADAFQVDVLAFQIQVAVPVVDQPPARTAAGGPTGTKHRKRYLFPTPEEIEAQELAVIAQAVQAPSIEAEDEDAEMMDVLAAYLANEDLF